MWAPTELVCCAPLPTSATSVATSVVTVVGAFIAPTASIAAIITKSAVAISTIGIAADASIFRTILWVRVRFPLEIVRILRNVGLKEFGDLLLGFEEGSAENSRNGSVAVRIEE